MTADELTKLAGVVAVFISSLLGILTWRENRRKGVRETTQQRTDREAAERGADLAMNDSQLRYFIESLRSDREKDREEMTRLSTRIESLETRLQAEQVTTIDLRATLAQAKVTIDDLNTKNSRLAARVEELEVRNKALDNQVASEDRADARSEREQDRQDVRDNRRDERERNRPS